MSWYETEFTKETAKQFLEECWNFTAAFILNNARDIIPSWPLSNTMSRSVFKFEPDGAVVHISETPSMWNALSMQTRHVFGTHFMVMSGQRSMHVKNEYPLLGALPSTLFMLYPPESIVPHSGFMSLRTWGIELRNAGKLRPVPADTTPMPLMPSEETSRNFDAIDNEKYDCYWRQDLWRHKFEGPVGRYENNFYEIPTVAQVTSLIVLLRVLDCLYGDDENYGLDRRMVIPSNCVSGHHIKLPFIHWNGVRDAMLERTPINPDWEWLAPLSHDACAFEGHNLDWEDEALLAEQFDHVRWRGDRDDGQSVLLDEGRIFELASGYKRSLGVYGYDTSDPDFSLMMWAISQGLGMSREEIVYTAMNRESTVFRRG